MSAHLDLQPAVAACRAASAASLRLGLHWVSRVCSCVRSDRCISDFAPALPAYPNATVVREHAMSRRGCRNHCCRFLITKWRKAG
jgi:hypothetical protein